MSSNNQKEKLFNENVGSKIEHLLEQYKLYVTMADNISNRRSIANGFFLTATSILIIIMGYVIQSQYLVYIVPIALIGLIISLFWFFLIEQYKKLNTAKFKVINKIEEKLPVMGFSFEWSLLKKGKERRIYWPLTHIEMLIPLFLSAVYLCLLLVTVFNIIIGNISIS